MVNKKLPKIASMRYFMLASILLVAALGLLLLPQHQKNESVTASTLLANAISPERYITADILAEKIINNDPSFILVDVRDEKSYAAYTLPNAINIPLDKLFNEESESYLDQDQFDVILFSNDDFKADQAWILCSRMGYKNLHVLKGGINNWFNTIINPPKPTESMSAAEFELYSFRKAASMYFGVAYPEEVKIIKKPAPKKRIPKKVIPVKKKKKMPVEGGC